MEWGHLFPTVALFLLIHLQVTFLWTVVIFMKKKIFQS